MERLAEVFTKKLAKKKRELIDLMIATGFKIASREKDHSNEDGNDLHELYLPMLFVFASDLPNKIVYPVYKQNIMEFCRSKTDPYLRKAGLKIMGFVVEPDALYTPMKDDMEEYTDIIIAGMNDENDVVRITACDTAGEFSEQHPDFLE